jgi:transcriptional regulator with XRE-family HTH domain
MPEEAYIGHKIRERRLDLGLSIRELGRRTDLTASFLSQVELGQANTSINSLRKIADALEVPMLFFFTESMHPDPVIRAAERPQITFSDLPVTYELLTPDRSRKMELFCGKLGPNTGNIARRLNAQTEECIFVLSGQLAVGLLSGEYLLDPGDSIYFYGDELESLSCGSDEEVRWISCITPPAF